MSRGVAANPAAFRAFIGDKEWAGKPFWMLNVLRFKAGGRGFAEYVELAREAWDRLPEGGRFVIPLTPARTIIGEVEYDAFSIVEYPSPAAFAAYVSTPEMVAANRRRVGGLAEQLLIPVTAGYTKDVRAARPPPPTPAVAAVGAADAAMPSGFLGGHHAQAPPARFVGLAGDARFADVEGPVWNVNLLRFGTPAAEAEYNKYAAAQGAGRSGDGGVLSSFGARPVYVSRRCHASLIGPVDWERVIVVEYPSRSHFLRMGAAPAYRAVAPHRLSGLAATYIIATRPPPGRGAARL